MATGTSHDDLQTLWSFLVSFWWVFAFFVLPAIGDGIYELRRWNRKRIKAKRRHQVAVARASARAATQADAVTAGPDDHGLREAIETLRGRYASGQISREEFLQAKVELEDL